MVKRLTSAGWSAGVDIAYAVVTGPVTVSTASVPTSARIGNLPTSALSTTRVALPDASDRACGSPASHTPLPFLSRQTSALRSGPSTTRVATFVVVTAGGGVGVLSP